MKKEVIVAVSGGFDPVHVGHVRLFEAAKKLGDRLVVILNSDAWLMNKKGYFFMPEDERVEVLKAFSFVDDVYVTEHTKDSDYRHSGFAIRAVGPDIFVNGGDKGVTNEFEVAACNEVGCKMVGGVGGGKVQSSSWLVNKAKSRMDER